MCFYVLVGAEAERFQLRDVLSADGTFDTDCPPHQVAAHRFPQRDSVVCVTLDGCSCSFLEAPAVGKVSRAHQRQRDTFYSALARAKARFGSIRLLVLGSDGSAEMTWSHRDSSASLRELLSRRHAPAQTLLRGVA